MNGHISRRPTRVWKPHDALVLRKLAKDIYESIESVFAHREQKYWLRTPPHTVPCRQWHHMKQSTISVGVDHRTHARLRAACRGGGPYTLVSAWLVSLTLSDHHIDIPLRSELVHMPAKDNRNVQKTRRSFSVRQSADPYIRSLRRYRAQGPLSWTMPGNWPRRRGGACT